MALDFSISQYATKVEEEVEFVNLTWQSNYFLLVDFHVDVPQNFLWRDF